MFKDTAKKLVDNWEQTWRFKGFIDGPLRDDVRGDLINRVVQALEDQDHPELSVEHIEKLAELAKAPGNQIKPVVIDGVEHYSYHNGQMIDLEAFKREAYEQGVRDGKLAAAKNAVKKPKKTAKKSGPSRPFGKKPPATQPKADTPATKEARANPPTLPKDRL